MSPKNYDTIRYDVYVSANNISQTRMISRLTSRFLVYDCLKIVSCCISLQTATVCDDIDLTEKLILEKLNNLDLSKSPGPDLLHPRVLYEVRHKIVYPLKLVFERSLKDQLGMLNDNRIIDYRNLFSFSFLHYRFSKCVVSTALTAAEIVERPVC